MLSVTVEASLLENMLTNKDAGEEPIRADQDF